MSLIWREVSVWGSPIGKCINLRTLQQKNKKRPGDSAAVTELHPPKRWVGHQQPLKRSRFHSPSQEGHDLNHLEACVLTVDRWPVTLWGMRPSSLSWRMPTWHSAITPPGASNLVFWNDLLKGKILDNFHLEWMILKGNHRHWFHKIRLERSTINPRYPKIQIWRDFLNKQVHEGLGYVPGVCWSCLISIQRWLVNLKMKGLLYGFFTQIWPLWRGKTKMSPNLSRFQRGILHQVFYMVLRRVKQMDHMGEIHEAIWTIGVGL